MMNLHELLKGLRALGHRDITIETFYQFTPTQLVELEQYVKKGLKELNNRNTEFASLMLKFKEENSK